MDFTELKRQINDKLTDLDDYIYSLGSEIDDLESSLDSAYEHKGELKTDLDYAEDTARDIRDILDEVKELETEMDDKDVQIMSLESQVKELKEAQDKLVAENDLIKFDNRRLKGALEHFYEFMKLVQEKEWEE